MKKFLNYLKNNIVFFSIIIFSVILATLIFSGKIEEIILKKSFEKAFFYRMVGDCDSFISYVEKNKEIWREKCLDEKNSLGTEPIRDFRIIRLTYSNKLQKAFLQVEVTRSSKPYMINYEMIRDGFGGLIANEIN